MNVLIYGDSINEFFIKDNCGDSWNGTYLSTWSSLFNYKNGSGTSGCNSSWGFIGHVHVYGSAMHGPYLHKIYEKKDDAYMDTVLRIPAALKEFQRVVGQPGFVIYRTELWDLHQHGGWNGYPIVADNSAKKAQLMKEFISNNIAMMNYLRESLPNAYIGIHTVPTIMWGMVLFHHYIAALQYITDVSSDFFLMDWNKLIHIYVFEGHAYLRDGHHPNLDQTKYFGMLMIEAFSTWINKCEPV